MNKNKARTLILKAGFSSTYEIERLTKLIELVIDEVDEIFTQAQLDARYENLEFTIDLRKKLQDHFLK
jgi:hypothetical protein